MRKIEDLEHFVLAEGETLILRPTRALEMEQLRSIRETVERYLPGRPVMVLTPELEVMAGRLEIMGVEEPVPEAPTEEEIAEARRQLELAYAAGSVVYVEDSTDDSGWFFVQRHANPHTFDWDRYEYRLTKKPEWK